MKNWLIVEEGWDSAWALVRAETEEEARATFELERYTFKPVANGCYDVEELHEGKGAELLWWTERYGAITG